MAGAAYRQSQAVISVGRVITKERLLQPAAGLALEDFALTNEETHNERDEH